MSFNINKICRVCLEEGAPHAFTSLFIGEFGLSPSAMLTHCAKVQIETNDGMPSNICSNCIYRLGVAYHFRQQCESSDIKLRQYLGLEFKSPYNFKDASTNTEIDIQPIVYNNEKLEDIDKKNLPVKKRIRKPASNRRKCEGTKLKRGPKPKPKQPPTCFDCGRSFKCTAQLEMHIRTHTGERPYTCTYCSRRFAQNYNLSIHLRTHTGEKPFQCEVCSKQFSALGNLQSHQKIHTGVRDHVCPICNKAFVTPGDLSRHMVTHTGIKNHHCDLCGKGFHRNRDLISHKNKVHNVARPAPIVPQPTVPPPTIHLINHETRDNTSNRRPGMPLLLAAPAPRRPLQGFRDETHPPHPPLLITHVQMNY